MAAAGSDGEIPAALRWLGGLWRGTGVAAAPSGDVDVEVELDFVPGPGGSLEYHGTATPTAGGEPVRAENGWWRVTVDGALEVLLTSSAGVCAIYLGATAPGRIDIGTDAVLRTETGEPVTAGQRIYGVVDSRLLFAVDEAVGEAPLRSRLSGRLERVPGTGLG